MTAQKTRYRYQYSIYWSDWGSVRCFSTILLNSIRQVEEKHTHKLLPEFQVSLLKLKMTFTVLQIGLSGMTHLC